MNCLKVISPIILFSALQRVCSPAYKDHNDLTSAPSSSPNIITYLMLKVDAVPNPYVWGRCNTPHPLKTAQSGFKWGSAALLTISPQCNDTWTCINPPQINGRVPYVVLRRKALKLESFHTHPLKGFTVTLKSDNGGGDVFNERGTRYANPPTFTCRG